MKRGIAILSTGEMGHRVAMVLKKNGLPVFTWLEGRSERTKYLAQRAEVEIVDTLEELLKKVDLVLSITIPSAALTVAQRIAASAGTREDKPLFVDANSISPYTAGEIEKTLAAVAIPFVDCCIIGSAANLERGTTFYAAGPWAEKFSHLRDFGLTVEIIGEKNGQASAFKMVYAGFTKGVSALLVELLLLARRMGILDKILALYQNRFPEVARFARENLPRLPFRASRRSEEMEELAYTLTREGLNPIMAPAAQKLLAALGELNLKDKYGESAEESWDLPAVLDILLQKLT